MGITWHDVWSWKAKIYRVIRIKMNRLVLRKCPYDHQLTSKAHSSAIRVTKIFQSFTYKMAANFAEIFGVRKLESLGFRVVMFV